MQIGPRKGFLRLPFRTPLTESVIDDIIFIVDRQNSCEYLDPLAKNASSRNAERCEKLKKRFSKIMIILIMIMV